VDSLQTRTVADRLLDALARRDYPAIADCFSADAAFRALVPRGLREATGAEPSAGWFQTWFGSAEWFQVLETQTEAMADRLHLAWRLRLEQGGQARLLSQHAFATIEDDRITRFDLVCSGFRPEAGAVLDGGDENCATLTPLIKRRVGQLAPHQVLEIVTRDPSAPSDIASWCALTGNVLLESRTDGTLYRTFVQKR
jgi:TusA-related sulfurtransferase